MYVISIRCVTACLVALLLAAPFSRAWGAPAFVEDFEGYANQAAFAAAWSPNGTPAHTLDTAFGRNSSRSLRLVPQTNGGGVTNRWYRNLDSPLRPTDANPVVFSFDFFLSASGASNGWSSDWQLVDVRAFSGGGFGVGSLNGLVAMGVSVSFGGDVDAHDNDFFQGRILAPGHATRTYYSLDALPTATPRSSGWHNLSARIGATQTLFSIDGQPAELVNVGITSPINAVVLGSDLPSRNPYWVDNIRLETVPEPAAAYLVGLAALAWLARSRRAAAYDLRVD